MRSPNKSRSRNKNNRNRNNNNIGNIVNRVFDSNGPDGRVRGTPNQIVEKYESLARDAQLAGDRVEAENFLQHAEHYIRLLAAAQEEVAKEQARRQAEHEARMAQRQQQQETDENNSKDSHGDHEMAEEKETSEKPKKSPRSKKKQKENSEPSEVDGFDEDNAPDFLKVIND